MPLRLTNRELERLVPLVLLAYAKNTDDKHWQELRGKILNMAGFRAERGDKRLEALMSTIKMDEFERVEEYWDNPDTQPRRASTTLREKMMDDPMLGPLMRKDLMRDE